MSESYLKNIKELILVRFLALPKQKKPGAVQIGKEMYVLFQEVCPASSAFDSLMETAFNQLMDEQCIERKPFSLKEAGRKRALQYLGVTELPNNIKWQTLCNSYLIAKAYGLDAGSADVRKQLQDINKLKGVVINHECTLNLGKIPTQKQAIDVLMWRQFGVETRVEFNQKNVIRHWLGMDLNEHSPLDVKTLRDVIVKKQLNTHSNRSHEIRQRILQQLAHQPIDQPHTVNNDQPVTLIASDNVDKVPDIEAFAQQVRHVAETSETGRFGERKVFINHIWKRMKNSAVYQKIDLPRFKGLLTDANKQGLLTLSRADIVAAMDANDVAESETQHLNATFHFVHI